MSNFTTRIADLADPSLAPEAIKTLHLMQASAGTGKTFSIQTIYLRLVLVEGLTVQQILTVTFTNDATKELRDRLQGILREALDYLDNIRPISDPNDRTKIVVEAAKTDTDEETIRKRLRLALIDFDMAAIFTIHGFCQRVLKRFAFETGQGFDVEPASNADEEIEQLCRDWWRQNIYGMDPELANTLTEAGNFSLADITTLAKTLIAKPDAILVGHDSSESTVSTPITAEIQKALTESLVNLDERSQLEIDYPTIDNATTEHRKQIETYRKNVEAKKWTAAIDNLYSITTMPVTPENPCIEQDQALENACLGFKKATNRLTEGYTVDQDGNLLNAKRDTLLPEHTANVRQAIKAFLDRVEQCNKDGLTVTNDKPTTAYQNILTLHEQFTISMELQADDLVSLIKDGITNKSRGMQKISIPCERIFPTLVAAATKLKGLPVLHAALQVKHTYQNSRAYARTASFNDYLVNLRKALKENVELARVLNSEFQAALIDEFQDTDPIQWGIFEKIFKDSKTPCFLVGDPKQAIYRFRNGDVETYLKATSDIEEDSKYPLTTNFRSEDRLIAAVNQLFADQKDKQTFGDMISFSPSQAPQENRAPILTIDGKVDQNPFKIRLIDNQSGSSLPGKYSATARHAYRLTAEEIARLLSDKNQNIGGKRIEPKHIAILVKRHVEGNAIAEELKALDIPSVRQGTGDVWQTDEGQDLWVMLEAVLDAHNPNPVRNALITSWGGISHEQLQMLNDRKTVTPPYCNTSGSMAMEDFVAIFIDLSTTWRKRGFPAMFRKLMAVLELKKRLLENPDKQGQRRLANIMHLSELIECKIMEARKTPEGVLAWIRRQFNKETADGGDETKLRLETDDKAVKIMTIFTSKGLQFPIVFAPTLFMMSTYQRGNTYEFHDDAGSLCIVQKTGDDKVDGPNKEKEKREMKEELVRQIYVATTRAVNRTVVIALNAVAKDGKPKKDEAQRFKPLGILGDLLQLPLKCDDDTASIDIEKAEKHFNNLVDGPSAIEISDASETDQAKAVKIDPPGDVIESPLKRPEVDKSRGHSSFSSILPNEHKTEQDFSAAEAKPIKDDDEGTGSEAEDPIIPPQGIFAFPAGAQTGTCWHELFENLDFANADDKTIVDLVTQTLKTYGFLKKEETQAERIEVTTEMVKNVLQVPLPKPKLKNFAKPFTFSAITNNNRKTEWAFNFSAISGKKTKEIKNAIAAHTQYSDYIAALGDWNKDLPGGYMTGFVDLLFRHGEYYFIADWKSNRRNRTQADFDQKGIREEMSNHRYWLQYLIYTVAVHQYLSNAMPGYDYDKHFGGVYYVFLRGVDGKQDKSQTNGVYYDRPPLALIKSLSSILGDF